MKRATVLLAALGLAGTVSMSAGGTTVSGQYVEARTAEIFTGGCIMGSEAETMGKQAVLAWKVDRGSVNGVSVDGLAVVAALAGDVNLGLHEIGGSTATVRTMVYVDERANAVQRMALVSLANGMTKRIGADVARELAKRGADVAVSYARSKQEAEDLVGEIKAMGRRSAAFQADLTNPDACAAVVEETAKTFGRLDILIPMASVYIAT